MINKKERIKELIESVADFVTSDLAKRSIRLQMGDLDAKRWARMYSAAGCHGYATKEAAIASLEALLC